MGLGVVGILDGSWGHLSSVPSESRWVDSTVRTMHFKFLTGNSDVKHICLSIIGLLKTFMCDPMLTTRFIARFQRETLYRTPHHVLLLFFNPSSSSIAFQLYGALCVSDGPDLEQRLYREPFLFPTILCAISTLSSYHLPSSSRPLRQKSSKFLLPKCALASMPQNYLHLGLSQTTQDDTVHYIQTALSARSQVLFQVNQPYHMSYFDPNHRASGTIQLLLLQFSGLRIIWGISLRKLK
jgi:hypothetical protein